MSRCLFIPLWLQEEAWNYCSYWLLWVSLHEFRLWLLVPIDVSVSISVYQLALPPWPASLFLLKAEAKHLCKICGYFYIIFDINPTLATQRSHFFFFFEYSQNMFCPLARWQKMLSILYYEILELFTTWQSLLIAFFIHLPSWSHKSAWIIYHFILKFKLTQLDVVFFVILNFMFVFLLQNSWAITSEGLSDNLSTAQARPFIIFI